jgi:hypothetical protein
MGTSGRFFAKDSFSPLSAYHRHNSSLKENPVEHSTLGALAVPNDSTQSGVSWGAVVAGAFVAAALSLSLFALGVGIGFSEVSPWMTASAASRIGWTAVIWLVVMEILASSIGGYLAGRLRTKWVSVHSHEVYFRDTAHGFLVWAVSLVIAVAFLASAATSVSSGSARQNPAAAEGSGPAQMRETIPSSGYFVDVLLRSNAPTSGQDIAFLRAEVGQILAHGLRERELSAADKSYLAQVVVARAGVSEAEAETRVDDVFARVQQSADRTRKAVAHSMYWTFLALLVGAFCASFAATIGGRQRDHVPAVGVI